VSLCITEWCAPASCIRKVWLQISIRVPAILADVFRGFPHFFLANVGIVAQFMPPSLPTVFFHSLLTIALPFVDV
jgi:hypothetical protein